MGKRVYDTDKFGGYLNKLRKERGIGFDQFRSYLGVSKAYLNDVETDACRPPTPEVQIKMMAILSAHKAMTEPETAEFYALAASAREEIPADILRFLRDDGNAAERIRQSPEFILWKNKIGTGG